MSVSRGRDQLQVRIDAAVQEAGGTEPLGAFLSIWDEFAEDYEALVIGMKATLKNDLVAKGIQATVYGRVKSEDSIKSSIERRKSQGDKYQNLGDVFKGIHDLAGFRIVVDYPSGIPEAENVVQQFVVVGRSEFTSDRDLGLDWTPIFGSFKSMNYRVKINRGEGDQLHRFRDVLVEIQVLSLAESLYNRLAHPLIYKRASGELSVKDQKIIDISHGLSLCYWICLSCMEENLGENQTIPRVVRQAGGGTEGVLPKLAAATPLPPSSSGTISIKTLLDFIRTNQEQKDKSLDKLCQQLGTIAGREAQASNHHSGSGHNIINFGSTTQQFGPSTTHHAPVSNNYYRSDPSNSDDIYVKALLIKDPRVEKNEIEASKGGLLAESSDWIVKNNDFKRWNDDKSSSILWINGDPGKGKTMLICRIINELSPETKLQNQSLNTVFSYFLCQAGNPDTDNATSVLRGMIYLLIKQDPQAMDCFRSECDKWGPLHFAKNPFTMTQLQLTFVRILEALGSRPVYLVIDALDECREGQVANEGRQALLKIITEHLSLTHVKWIVSSRKKPQIAEYLARASTNISLELNEPSISAAVFEYVNHKVDILSHLKQYEKKTTQDLKRILYWKSQSTFLWVALACQMLSGRGSWDPVKELDKFPPGLDALYLVMLEEIQSDELFEQIIAVMLTVFRPISLLELQSLVPLFPKTVPDRGRSEIIGYCGSFLSIRKSFVHFVHESAKEFLSNPIHHSKCDAQEQHYGIVKTSLKIMSQSLQRDMSQDHLRVNGKLGSLRYPCTQWVFHLAQCTHEKQAHELAVGSQTDGFLRKSYLHWLQALGHMGAISDGIRSMLELSGKVLGQTSDIAELIRDEAWFIRYHKRGIEQSPPVVYAALVLSPAFNMTKKVYHQKEPKWITLRTKTEGWWSHNTQSMEGHTRDVTDISFSYDSRLLVSASDDKTARVWHVATGESIHILRGHTERLRSVTFSGSNYRIASASPREIKIWNGEKGENINTLRLDQQTEGRADSVALSNDGDLVACIVSDGTVELWHAETGSHIRTFEEDPFEIGSRYSFSTYFAISQCGHFLASSNRYKVSIWNMQQSQCSHVIPLGYRNLDHPIRFSSKGRLWVLDGDNVIFWDLHTKEIHQRRKISEMVLCDAEVFGDCDQVSSTSPDSLPTTFENRIWKWVNNHYESMDLILFSPTGSLFASTAGREVKIWDLTIQDTTSPQWDKPNFLYFYQSVYFSPDGFLIVTQPGLKSHSEKMPSSLWHFATGKVEREIGLQHTSEPPCRPFFSPSGEMMAYTQDHRVSVENVKTGAKSAELEAEIGKYCHARTESIALSSDDQWLAVVSDRKIHVFDVKKGTMVKVLDCPSDSKSKPFVFSRDSQYLAGDYGDYVMIWNTSSCELERTLDFPENGCFSQPSGGGLVFSEDTSYLVSSWRDSFRGSCTKVNIWKLSEEDNSRTFELNIPCVIQSFDPRLSRIETNGGAFDLNPNGPCRRGYGLSKDEQWVVRGSDCVLWLPPEFRPSKRYEDMSYSVHAGYKIAIGTVSGRVLCLEFDPAGLKPDL